MGRKIPGKRHRGIKDPEKQQLIRVKSVQHKINEPPSNTDQQDVSKSLQHFIKIKDKFKGNLKNKRKNRSKAELILTDPKLKKKDKSYKTKDSAPAFNQKEGESIDAFMNRVDQTVKEILQESKFEDKYNVKVQRNLKTGEVSNISKQRVDPLMSLVKETREKGNGKKLKVKKPKLTKSQKMKQKLDARKLQKELEKAYDFNIHTDEVEFGDIVHAPPTLVTPKMVHKINCAPRPGQKNLLLKSIFNQNMTNEEAEGANKKTVFQKIQGTGKINKTGKRKNLPHAIRRQLETQRNEIVNAYKSLKAKKFINNI